VRGGSGGGDIIIIMVSGGGGSREAGKKRKAASPEAAVRREPRRGLGVAELERIRVALEVAERCYAAPPQQPAPALPPAALVVHGASLATVRAPPNNARQVVFVASNSPTIISRDGDSP